MNFNLIGSSHKTAFKNKILIRILYFSSSFVVAWLFIFGIVIFAAIQFFYIQNKALQDSISMAEAVKEIEEAGVFEDQIVEINALSRHITGLEQDQPYETIDLLREIFTHIPQGVNLTRVSFNINNDAVTIEGHANQRVQVISLEENLRSSVFWLEVDAPLSNLLQPSDISFIFHLRSIQEG